jgi:hypothetical protein
VKAAGLLPLSLALMLACGDAGPDAAPRTPPAAAADATAAPPPVPPPLPAVAPGDVRTLVVDRPTLDALEAPAVGWSFGAILARASGDPAPPTARPDLAWMHANVGAWRVLGSRLGRDIDAVIEPIERPLVTELKDALAYPAGNVGRRLDLRWLGSPDAHVSLAGVVNRLDRRDLHTGPSCGEVRLVYRLAYTQQRDDGPAVGSRLPLTLNAVLVPTETADCAAVARRWASLPEGPELAAALAAGPLQDLRLDRFEVNAQVVRFPSGLATEFAGQALYLLRVYRLDEAEGGVAAVAVPLENTPDVTRLRADPALRAELAAWLGQHIGDVDQGTYLLPERFLTDTALSWSTLGVNRGANHPMSAVFLDHLDELPDPTGTADLRFIASKRGLLERLDNGTCTGCHQAGSTAGFHLLGPDGETAGVTNRLASPVSPHLAEERSRRKMLTADIASGTEPDRFRAHALAPNFGMKGYVAVGPNQPCLPDTHRGDLQPAATWSCATGTCDVVAADPTSAINWGQCMPAEADMRAGQTCRQGAIRTRAPRTEGAFNQGAYADKVDLSQRWGLPEDKTFAADAYNCRPTVIGVPLGRTYRRCTAEERTLDAVKGELGGLSPDICAVVGGSKFDRCVEQDFHACLEQIVGRGMVATCSADVACREDMICQSLPWQLEGVPDAAGEALTAAGVGFCTPTYFLFQLRLDGHPVPRAG